jgi:integrase
MARRRPQPWTDEDVKNLTGPPGKLHADPACANLFIRMGTRSKAYQVVARQPGGRQIWTTISRTDRMTLAAAQIETRRIVDKVRAGEPSSDVPATEVTLAAVAAAYEMKEGRHQRRWPDKKRRLAKWLLPRFGKHPFLSIKRSEVNALLDDIQLKSARGADQVLVDLQALEKFYLTMSQASDTYVTRFRNKLMPRRSKRNLRERTLSPEELRVIWTIAGESDRFGVVLKILLLSGQRLTKVLSMEWDHLNLNSGEWRIPRAAGEKGVPKLLTLPPPAIELIKTQPQLARYVFSSVRGTGHMLGLSEMKRDFDAKVRVRLPGVERWTLHDLRRTSRTMMSKAKIDFFVAEAVLGHKIPGVAGIYQRDDFTEEMAIALVKLAAHIEAIVAGPAKAEPRTDKRKRLAELLPRWRAPMARTG